MATLCSPYISPTGTARARATPTTPQRRWLDSIKTQTQYGSVLQNMSYHFDLVGNILGYDNAAGSYETTQSYGYDALSQSTSTNGTSIKKPYGINDYVSTYNQSFAYDQIGNLTQKTSSCSTNPSKSLGDDLNYGQSYSYYAGKAHQAEIIGNLYYRYDANGNMIEERPGGAHYRSRMGSWTTSSASCGGLESRSWRSRRATSRTCCVTIGTVIG